MIRDRAQLARSLSLSLSSSLLRLAVPAIVVKSARRTGRGLLQLPSMPLVVRLPPMLTVHRSPSLTLPCPSTRIPHRYALPPLPRHCPVCHEMHVKTYLVRFPRGGGEGGRVRTERTCRDDERERERERRTQRGPRIFAPSLSSPPLTAASSRHFPLYSAVHGFSLSRRNHRDIGEKGEKGGRRTPRQSRAWAISLFRPRVYNRATEEAGSRATLREIENH